eukprot:gene8858-11948_t
MARNGFACRPMPLQVVDQYIGVEQNLHRPHPLAWVSACVPFDSHPPAAAQVPQHGTPFPFAFGSAKSPANP